MGIIRESLENGPGVLAGVAESAARNGLQAQDRSRQQSRNAAFQAAQYEHESDMLGKVLDFKQKKQTSKHEHEMNMAKEAGTQAHQQRLDDRETMRTQGDVMHRISQFDGQSAAQWGPQGGSFSFTPTSRNESLGEGFQESHPDHSQALDDLRGRISDLATSYENDSKMYGRNMRQGNPKDSGMHAALKNVAHWHAQDMRGLLNPDEE